MARSRVRASVRLWQTELFIVVIVVAILILSASLTAGLRSTLTTLAEDALLRNAQALAGQLSAELPLTVDTAPALRSRVEEYRRIYGDDVWVYGVDGTLLDSATGASTPPDAQIEAARVQGLSNNPPYSDVALKEGGFTVVGTAIDDPFGQRAGSLVVASPVTTALTVLDAVRSRLWVTFWVALIVAGALGFAFSEFIGRRVRAMSDAAAAIAAGDFSQRLPTGFVPDEVGELAESYNRMAVRLGDAFSAIQQREREIAAVVESMAEGVIAFDSAGTVRVMNHEAATLLEDPDVRLVGAPVHALTSDAEVLAVVATGLAGDAVAATVELGRRTVLLHCTPLVSDAGEKQGAVLLLSDVTEQKRLEDAQRRFIANASHEMRTPISAVKGLLELLEDGALEDRDTAADFVHTMQLEIDRLGRLVADLLTLAQLEAGTFQLRLQPESATSLAEEVARVMRALAERNGVELAVEAPDGDVDVVCDRDRIVQVLLGFVDNALKHSQRGQRVTLRVRAAEKTATLEVSDEGPGINPDAVGRIFDRFFRADEARSAPRGAGLGLSIAKEIVDAHGTRIVVDSTPGHGATFGFTLPRA